METGPAGMMVPAMFMASVPGAVTAPALVLSVVTDLVPAGRMGAVSVMVLVLVVKGVEMDKLIVKRDRWMAQFEFAPGVWTHEGVPGDTKESQAEKIRKFKEDGLRTRIVRIETRWFEEA